MTVAAREPSAWLALAGARLHSGDLAGAVEVTVEALAVHPDSAGLWGLHGVALAALGRTAEAAAALDRASSLDPADPEPLRNLVSVHTAGHRWSEARQAAGRLLALAPRDPGTHRLLGAVAAGGRDFRTAESRLRAAVRLDPHLAEAWADLVAVIRLRSGDEALAAAREALSANPDDPRLAALHADLQAMAAAEAAVAARPDDLGPVRDRLELAMRRLADETRPGRAPSPGQTEGLALQAAHDALLAALDAGLAPETLPWVATPVFMRLLAHDAVGRLGGFEALGRRWGLSGEQRNLLMQIPRAGATRADRLELLDQHRLLGAAMEAAAARAPITVEPRAPGGRIRLGFKSSDLRDHAVGAFAWPLFEHLDHERFEVHVYSFFPGPPDPMQKAIAERVAAYHHRPDLDTRGAAELIAAEGLDVLFELGGPTGWNKLDVMAYRLAPIQASWLGYPHSTGLSTIDYLLLDPCLAPPDPSLLLEAPLLMPRSFIVMGSHFFRDDPPVAPAPPGAASGLVTFGTANASYKYSPACLDAWAQVLAAAPGSRFLFIRPEGDSPTFRANALAAFARRGVTAERIGFDAVRGEHLPFYDRLDISLDTFPLTGGTTTCESLWMGVPVVSLVGEAVYERLSYSILSNAGLPDLCADSVPAYVETAARLAADKARLAELRSGLRDRIRGGPLGDPAGFARDFYDLVAGKVVR